MREEREWKMSYFPIIVSLESCQSLLLKTFLSPLTLFQRMKIIHYSPVFLSVFLSAWEEGSWESFLSLRPAPSFIAPSTGSKVIISSYVIKMHSLLEIFLAIHSSSSRHSWESSPLAIFSWQKFLKDWRGESSSSSSSWIYISRKSSLSCPASS